MTSKQVLIVAAAAVLALLSIGATTLPPGGTFSDDDLNVHEGDIEAIAVEGITRGCNPPTNDRYCPSRPVTRGEMAAMLVRALDLVDRADDPFVDDDGSIFEADIERLAAAGITVGCNPPANDRYCPGDPVSREQMAALLVRGFTYTDPGPGDHFVDDDASIFESDIDKLATAGVTTGCNPPANTRYCPSDTVTRDQIASFIARAKGLTPIEPPPGSATFVAAGDIGGDPEPESSVLSAMAAEDGDFFLVLGDLSYEEITPESAWCDWLNGFFPAGFPIEVVAGNHEDNGPDGYIRSFTACLPDRMGSIGDYGVEYFFDHGPVRVIMIAADLSVDGTSYDYDIPGPRRDWLLARVDEAEAEGRWTVVGMHKACVTTGNKSCEVGESLIDDLINHGADLILHGHDHNYQRSHQLSCVDAGKTTPACVVDTDGDHQAEAGAVIVFSGWVGRSGYATSSSDTETGYFAVLGGPNQPGWGPGYLTVTADATSLTGTWTTVGGGNSDSFTISR